MPPGEGAPTPTGFADAVLLPRSPRPATSRTPGPGVAGADRYDIIVRGHLGELRMDTVPGRSAAFTLSLPRRSRLARLRSAA